MNAGTVKKLLALGTEVAGAAIDGTPPNPISVAKQLMGIGLDLVPVGDLHAYLSDEARKRIDADLDAEQFEKTHGR